MFCLSDHSQYQFMLRSSRNISKERRKFSAGYKKRNYNDRSKEKQHYIFNYTSQQIPNPKKTHNHTNLTQHFKTHNLNALQDKSTSIASNKKIALFDTSKSKNQDFSIIMENIKDVFKANQKNQTKESGKQAKRK